MQASRAHVFQHSHLYVLRMCRYTRSTVWELEPGPLPKLLDLRRSTSVDLVPLAALLTQPYEVLAEKFTAGGTRLDDFGWEGSCFGLRWGLRAGNESKRLESFFTALQAAGYHGWRGVDAQGRIEFVMLLGDDKMKPLVYGMTSEV